MSLRIGIVGAGANTRRRHIPALRSLPGVTIQGVANASRPSTDVAATELGIPLSFDRWADLVESRDIDAVVVGTWPDLHHDVTLAALDAGKHVMVEARMARNIAEARSMLEAARRSPGLVCQVVPSPLTVRLHHTVHSLIKAGRLGEVLVVDARFNASTFIDYESSLHWRQDRARSGSNIMELGIVYESLMRWVGDAECVTATASVNVARRWDPVRGTTVDIDIPDHLAVTARLNDGGQEHIQLSAVTGLAPSRAIWIYGSEATLCIDVDDGLVAMGERGDDALTPLEGSPEDEVGWQVEAEFVAAIRGAGSIRFTTFEDGVRYMEFVDAVERAISSGCREFLSPQRAVH